MPLKVLRPLEDVGKIFHSFLHVLAFIFQSASKEHLVRSVEVVVIATPVFDAIRSAAGVFVQKGGLETSVTKVPFKPPLAYFFFSVTISSQLKLNTSVEILISKRFIWC